MRTIWSENFCGNTRSFSQVRSCFPTFRFVRFQSGLCFNPLLIVHSAAAEHPSCLHEDFDEFTVMSSTKFQPLANTDEYTLNDMSQSRQQSVDANSQIDPNAQTPARWKSIRSAYTPQVTFVAAPKIDTEVNEKEVRPTKYNRRSTSRLTNILNPVTNFSIPRFAAPWQHERPEGSAATTTVRSFDRHKQWRRLFVNGFLQWLFTLAIVMSQWATLYGFSRESTLSKYQKYTFNALTTLLSLSLGLAIVAALRSYAKLLSWRFLASKYRDLQDFELVMNCNSQLKVLKLLWASRTEGQIWPNKTQILCVVSLLVVIGLQITIGLLGLTYSIDNSLESRYENGTVSLVDLSNVYQSSTYNVTNFPDQSGAANYYGLVGQNYWSSEKALGQGDEGFEYVYTSDNQSYFYNFVDMNAEPQHGQQPAIKTSKRWVQSNASCVPLKILAGGYLDENTTHSRLNYTDESGRFRSIFVDGQTAHTTTYMSNSSNATTCGSRCTSMLILDSAGFLTDEDPGKPYLFACNNTVSQVYNSEECTTQSDCTLSDKLARILAGAIGWSGTWYPNNPMQYKTYPPGSPYSWDGFTNWTYNGHINSSYQNAQWRASQISYFTTAAIAAMDDSGPHIVVPGKAPQPGVTLNVNWKYSESMFETQTGNILTTCSHSCALRGSGRTAHRADSCLHLGKWRTD